MSITTEFHKFFTSERRHRESLEESMVGVPLHDKNLQLSYSMLAAHVGVDRLVAFRVVTNRQV